MSTVLTKGIVDYLHGQPHSSLEIIDIVIYDQHLLEDYATTMKKAVAITSALRYSGRRVHQVTKKTNLPQN